MGIPAQREQNFDHLAPETQFLGVNGTEAENVGGTVHYLFSEPEPHEVSAPVEGLDRDKFVERIVQLAGQRRRFREGGFDSRQQLAASIAEMDTLAAMVYHPPDGIELPH